MYINKQLKMSILNRLDNYIEMLNADYDRFGLVRDCEELKQASIICDILLGVKYEKE